MGEETRPAVHSLRTGTRTSPALGSSLIPIINKLHDILAPVGGGLTKISLPQVAVIGSQSSGKSSVLEALVGRDFLLRGCDICTRRPLVLMLENRPETPGDDGKEWGEFRHFPGKRFYDFSKIRREIQAETEKEAGLNKGVSAKQIFLKISSPNVLNMTLVDLPGITKVPVGDQPSDIEARIRKMIMVHISQQNCIILAVSPANSDLATSDALQMAREADPTGRNKLHGSRTIGVITKLDIMDRGTNACNFLLGKVVPLHLGYIGVVNRSQEDINNSCSISDALSYEEKFFQDHPVYNSLSGCCGIPQLGRKLNQVGDSHFFAHIAHIDCLIPIHRAPWIPGFGVLLGVILFLTNSLHFNLFIGCAMADFMSQILEQHIRMVLPSLKSELNAERYSVVKELETCGKAVASYEDKGSIVLDILSKYCKAFSAKLDGSSPDMFTKELSGGARILYIFQTTFVKSLEEVDPCEDLSDDEIRTAIQNAAGIRNCIFVPEVPFEVLVKKQIDRLLEPSLQCLQYVYDELMKISRTCEVAEMRTFPVLRRNMDDIMRKFLRTSLKPTESMIKNLIDMEMDYINSSHPNFLGGSKAVELAMNQLKSQQGSTDVEKGSSTEKGQKTRGSLLPRLTLPNLGTPSVNDEKPASSGNASMRTWGISSIFGSRGSSGERLARSRSLGEPDHSDQMPSRIQLTEVNHAKRQLYETFIQKLHRQDLFDMLLEEQDEVVLKRKCNEELFQVLDKAIQTLEEVESDVSTRSSHSSFGNDDAITCSPRATGISTRQNLRNRSEVISSYFHILE
ncbi:hypothetical protein TIFTF001_014768 [Ficus carica]|uniref:Dynamin-type G domain-containing protein n=1 Tax=Ficus carica TaxID=3494 RepID=A0AA88A6P6_FICCA|nr:hypothetical protein TIFTF001_014768 [Ficus carica]